MCGIFGIILAEKSKVAPKTFEAATASLFKLSEARGKESAGLAVRNGGPIQVFKQPIPASLMIRSAAYKRLIHGLFENGNQADRAGAIIGHSRLVTNGFQEHNDNNQPVIAEGLVAIHNGIITNDEALWRQYPSLQHQYEVDTEVLLRLIRMYQREGRSPTQAVRAAFNNIQGCASVAMFFNELNSLLLATNNGSLYTLRSADARVFVFASERYILRTLAARRDLHGLLDPDAVERIEPGRACWINLHDLKDEPFALSGDAATATPGAVQAQEVIDVSSRYDRDFAHQRVRAYSPVLSSADDDVNLLYKYGDCTKALKRCTRCVLPETYPFITFDPSGVCNYCRNHFPMAPKGPDALAAAVERFRKRSKEPDCLVAVSGGRDSTYGLHYMKNVLGMNPIAYTYDWGMVTDLARRNISRICGKLGVEHLLVSADINKKRDNIRKNILAWLKRPDLGIIPLFMAGDKHFYYYANQLEKQTGIGLVIWCSGSGLENADFKWYLCGLKNADSSALAHKVKLLQYYGKQFLFNPSYLNSSLLDTLFAFYSYYVMPKDVIYLFSYLPWNENEILSVLTKDYDWEVASDTRQTWRIGDGTASFYNYIYHTVAGFTENDTFRSEQIRRGMMPRDQALAMVEHENRPRYESIKWYLSIIGLGDQFNRVIKTINAMPKVYPVDR
jgi:glutamine---fructose-6-phosphate transaminase (isomerizing)